MSKDCEQNGQAVVRSASLRIFFACLTKYARKFLDAHPKLEMGT